MCITTMSHKIENIKQKMFNKNWNNHFGGTVARKQFPKLHAQDGQEAFKNIQLLFLKPNNEEY